MKEKEGEQCRQSKPAEPEAWGSAKAWFSWERLLTLLAGTQSMGRWGREQGEGSQKGNDSQFRSLRGLS